MLPQSDEFDPGPVPDELRAQAVAFADELPSMRPVILAHLEDIEQSLASLILGQQAMMETLAWMGTKLGEFEERAEPLLRKAEQRGRLFGAKPQNPMDRHV